MVSAVTRSEPMAALRAARASWAPLRALMRSSFACASWVSRLSTSVLTAPPASKRSRGDTEAFLDAGDGFRLHGGESLRLQDAVEAAGNFVDELVAGGGESFLARLGAVAGHVFAGIALAVENPPLGGDGAPHVVGVVGIVGIERGVHHVEAALIQSHHERLRWIVGDAIVGGEADGGIVIGLRLAQHGLGGIDAAFGRLQGGGIFEGSLDRFVEGDGAGGGDGQQGGEEE